MFTVRNPGMTHVIPLLLLICSSPLPISARYSGGTGAPADPFLIATVEDLLEMSGAAADWDKHFRLTASIDLAGIHWSTAVIPSFAGSFDGDGHPIRHLTISGDSHLGLIGRLAPGGRIYDLRVMDADIVGTGDYLGIVAGSAGGYISNTCSTGTIRGRTIVGGLVGYSDGFIARCCVEAQVTGATCVGGLIGVYEPGNVSVVSDCHAVAAVSGDTDIGGLIGLLDWWDFLWPDAWLSYTNRPTVRDSYSTGPVTGQKAGGLIGGINVYDALPKVLSSFWDMETSGQLTSKGGEGKTTSQMQTAETYIEAGWDFMTEIACKCHGTWQMPDGRGYPVLSVFHGYDPPTLSGQGTTQDPYLVCTATDLIAMRYVWPDARCEMAGDIDLSCITWRGAVIPHFAGSLDGNGFAIRNLTATGRRYLGLFGVLYNGSQVRHLAVVNVNIAGTESCVGPLAGCNWGDIADVHATGTIAGDEYVGGLVGFAQGRVHDCSSRCTVQGNEEVGGLVGGGGALITRSCTRATVSGKRRVGGLIGSHGAWELNTVSDCYASTRTSGETGVGGLIGHLDWVSDAPLLEDTDTTGVDRSYSCGLVTGTTETGGLVGRASISTTQSSFWDTEASGQTISAGGTGRTTAEMMTASTFLNAGWDFAGTTANGEDDIWWILEGEDYPRLWWESNHPIQ